MKVGDKLKCKNDINNLYGDPLFIKDNIYEILYIDEQNEVIVLNHVLYANEYAEQTMMYVRDNFDII